MLIRRKNNEKSPIIILGVPYRDGNRSEMKIHVGSLFRFTYRKDFPSLHPYPISSDAGWGCMLRSAQMLMACALQRHLLGHDWRKSDNINILRGSTHYCDILKLFSDYPGAPHMYSIHHLVQCGMRYDKLPGEWFGPSTAALVLRDLTKLHRNKYGGVLEVLVTQGDTIYIRDCENLCSSISKENGSTFCPTEGSKESPEEPSQEHSAEHSTVPSLSSFNGTEKNFLGNDVANIIPGINISSSNGHVRTVSTGIENPSSSTGGDVSVSTSDTSHTAQNGVLHSDRYEEHSSTGECSSSNPSAILPTLPSHIKYQKLEKQIAEKTESIPNIKIKSIEKVKKIEKKNNTEKVDPVGKSPEPLFDPLFNPPPSYTSPWNCSLVVCIPLRLGISSVSNDYIEELKECLRNPYCLGFVGGRVNHAIYFVGYKLKGDGSTELLGLDPHSVYAANKEEPFPSPDLVSQVHVSELDALDSSRLDPSLALAFYFRNREEFEVFCEDIRSKVEKKKTAGITPLFCIQHSAPSYGSYGWSGDDQGEDEGDECEEDEYILV